MKKKSVTLFILLSLLISRVYSQSNIYYNIELNNQFGKGSFSPYYFSTNNHGVSSIENNNSYLRAGIFKDLNYDKNFSYGAGIDLIGSTNDYSNFKLQQFYLESKLYFINISAGLKEYNAAFKNQKLSSGGLIWSGNSMPIPELRVGIYDFVAIPGTNGWLQIKGDISYGKFIDDKWKKDNYNYIYSFITTDVWFHQKKIFFRSKESKKFIVTLYAEMAGQFGGTQRFYDNGELIKESKDKVNIKDFLNMIIPSEGGSSKDPGDQAYIYGNHLGSWNAIFEYKFKNSSKIKGYFEWLFEDGSGMGKLNGWDGLWGLEYNTNRKSLISDIVVEYLQTTNQSGPIHWAPNDYNDPNITTEATGADDYYNNYFYNGWANYGMAIGNGLLKSPIYNKDGYLRFTNNRIKAYHLGIKGHIMENLSYYSIISYSNGWGTPFLPTRNKQHQFSGIFEISYHTNLLKSTQFNLGFGYDKGNVLNKNWGIRFSIINKNILF